jgi:hypothetical protein
MIITFILTTRPLSRHIEPNFDKIQTEKNMINPSVKNLNFCLHLLSVDKRHFCFGCKIGVKVFRKKLIIENGSLEYEVPGSL